MKNINPTETKAWQQLTNHFNDIKNTHLKSLFNGNSERKNNLSINFFDMWIYEIYINKVSTQNKFMSQKSQNLEPGEYITIKLAYGSSVSQEKK